MRGGGKRKDKTSKAARKRDRSPEKPKQTRGQEAESQLEHNTDKLDDNREQVEDKIQQYLMKSKDRARLDIDQMRMMEKAVRWAVEARRERNRKGARQESALQRRRTVRGDASAQ